MLPLAVPATGLGQQDPADAEFSKADLYPVVKTVFTATRSTELRPEAIDDRHPPIAAESAWSDLGPRCSRYHARLRTFAPDTVAGKPNITRRSRISLSVIGLVCLIELQDSQRICRFSTTVLPPCMNGRTWSQHTLPSVVRHALQRCLSRFSTAFLTDSGTLALEL